MVLFSSQRFQQQHFCSDDAQNETSERWGAGQKTPDKFREQIKEKHRDPAKLLQY